MEAGHCSSSAEIAVAAVEVVGSAVAVAAAAVAVVAAAETADREREGFGPD